MNYIYDILLNFNPTFYDFYDWNENDNIMHIRKIPIIRTNSLNFFKIKNNQIKFNQSFLNQLENKTEIFKSRKTDYLKHAFLLTDGTDVIGIYINKNQMYSDLLIDEKDEILEVALKLEETNIDFEIIKPLTKFSLITRNEQKIIKYLHQELNKMEKNKDTDKIKYLYYECFDIKNNNYKDALNKIKKEIKVLNHNFYSKLYNIFKLTIK